MCCMFRMVCWTKTLTPIYYFYLLTINRFLGCIYQRICDCVYSLFKQTGCDWQKKKYLIEMIRNEAILGLSDLLLSEHFHAVKPIGCAKYRNTFDENRIRFIWISLVTSAFRQTQPTIIKPYFSLNICVTSSLTTNVLRPFYIYLRHWPFDRFQWFLSTYSSQFFASEIRFSRFYFNFYSFYRLKLIEWLIAMVWIDLVWKTFELFFFSNPDIIWLSEAYPDQFAFLLARLVEKLDINHQLTVIEIPITFQLAFVYTILC